MSTFLGDCRSSPWRLGKPAFTRRRESTRGSRGSRGSRRVAGARDSARRVMGGSSSGSRDSKDGCSLVSGSRSGCLISSKRSSGAVRTSETRPASSTRAKRSGHPSLGRSTRPVSLEKSRLATYCAPRHLWVDLLVEARFLPRERMRRQMPSSSRRNVLLPAWAA